MASQLRLHLAATPPLLLPHLRHLPRPLCPTLNPIRARLPALPVPRVLSHARPVRAVGGGIEPKEGVVAEGEEESGGDGEPLLVGEDSAAFELKDQSVASWAYFAVILTAVLVALNVLWIDPGTGVGTKFLDAVASVSDSHEVVMLLLTIIFAVVHSGMASLRESGEKIVGERAYRVLFAGISLPLAVTTIVYFINHRYDGIQLWQVQGITGIHELVWISSFISFFFLYPSTFNLLEVAAVDKPKLHMWETGIMRITRHPQMVGQVIWCLAHTLWIGNSVAVVASVGLISHHLFGAWNGDRRLVSRYGEAFEVLKKRTSVVPFAAILDGRQKLPKDYHKEFFRLPYVAITILTLGAYFAHPLMQASSYQLP
ncbi:15-cis-zeta-carotene isomerase, chloroplastic isoform X3 [Miscanthus floridulus]